MYTTKSKPTPIPAKFISGRNANWLYKVPSNVAEPIPKPIPNGFLGVLGTSGLESEFESNPLLSDELFSRPSDFFSEEGISFSFTFELSIFSFISFVSFLSEGFLLSSIFCSNSGSLGYSLALAGACIKLPEEPLSAF